VFAFGCRLVYARGPVGRGQDGYENKKRASLLPLLLFYLAVLLQAAGACADVTSAQAFDAKAIQSHSTGDSRVCQTIKSPLATGEVNCNTPQSHSLCTRDRNAPCEQKWDLTSLRLRAL